MALQDCLASFAGQLRCPLVKLPAFYMWQPWMVSFWQVIGPPPPILDSSITLDGSIEPLGTWSTFTKLCISLILASMLPTDDPFSANTKRTISFVLFILVHHNPDSLYTFYFPPKSPFGYVAISTGIPLVNPLLLTTHHFFSPVPSKFWYSQYLHIVPFSADPGSQS